MIGNKKTNNDMNNNYKLYIITGLVFVLCVAGGFVIAKKIVANSIVPSDTICPERPPEIVVPHDTVVPSSQPVQPQQVEQIPVAVLQPTKSKLTNEELTSIINNLSNKNFPRNVTLRYNNLDKESGEESLTSISLIRQYIQLGTWKSVTVTSATFDNDNNVTSITMTINR